MKSKLIFFNLLIWFAQVLASETEETDSQFHIACRSNDMITAKKILEDDKNRALYMNRRGNGGQTPLMAAVLSGSTEVVSYLLQEGADHNIPEQGGYTPIHGMST